MRFRLEYWFSKVNQYGAIGKGNYVKRIKTILSALDHTIRIGSTPTFLYFDLYLYSAYAAHYVYYKQLVVLALIFLAKSQ